MNITKLSKNNFKTSFTLMKDIKLSDRVWLCGGAVRDCILGKTPNDWDFFSVEKNSLDRFEEHLKELGFQLISDTKNVKTYTNKNLRFQLIHIYFKTPEDYIENCDFTLCQFVWDGNDIICNSEALVHIYEKKIIINKLQDKYIFDSIRRLQKYIKYGYTICNGGIMALIEAIRGAKQEEIMKSFEFYPNTNTPRFMRWD